MAWQGIYDHDAVVERFRRAAGRGHFAGSYLFVGPSGIGKRHFALTLAKGFLCKSNNNDKITPCGECESCKLFGPPEKDLFAEVPFASPHPDFFYICKPESTSFIPVELITGGSKHRGESGLCYLISRSPFMGNGKVAIIDDADCFNQEGANALLKTLEEPPDDSIIILIGTSAAKQLPTIRSRCQIMRFAPLQPKTLAKLLERNGVVHSFEQGLTLSRQAQGIDQAKDLFNENLDKIRTPLFKIVSSADIDSASLAVILKDFLDSTAKDKKEASAKRKLMRIVFGLLIDYFRGNLKTTVSSAEDFQKKKDSIRLLSYRIEHSLDAIEQIDRNAQLEHVIDMWSLNIAGSVNE
ncbi:ATPase AAA [Planctomycetales bacterium]|nr:ATPase AAA [Planctomycetales bacterium]GHT35190.1 ATPase AAA [Planctomycetales bacterium]